MLSLPNEEKKDVQRAQFSDALGCTQECGYSQGHSRQELQAQIQTHAGTCEKCKQPQHHDFVLTSLEVKLSLGAAF